MNLKISKWKKNAKEFKTLILKMSNDFREDTNK
jgi:hypothetical protein